MNRRGRKMFVSMLWMCAMFLFSLVITIRYIHDMEEVSEEQSMFIARRGFEMKRLAPKYNATSAMQQRRNHIMKLCHTDKYRQNFLVGVHHSSLQSLDRRTMTYCPIPKCGWSTWKRLFYIESGIEELMADTTKGGFNGDWRKAGLRVINNDNAQNKQARKTTHRMVFVRNPYDRLLSAYKDKVLANNGSQIRRFSKFCKVHKLSDSPKPALTFSQFVECVIEQATMYKTAQPDVKFGAGINFHWRPQTLLCNFCDVNYNIIGHLEHMNEDITAALLALNLTKTAPLKENASRADDGKELTLSDWYSQVNSELLKDIQRLYLDDFELLGYSTNYKT